MLHHLGHEQFFKCDDFVSGILVFPENFVRTSDDPFETYTFESLNIISTQFAIFIRPPFVVLPVTQD